MPGVIHRVLETGVLLLCILDVHHALRCAHVPRRSAERAPNDWARSTVLTSGGEARRLGSARRRMRLKETLQTLCVWFVYIGVFPMIEGILGWIIPFWSTIQTLWLLWMLANRRIVCAKLTQAPALLFSRLIQPTVSRYELHIDDTTRWVHGFLLFSVNIIGSIPIISRAGSIRASDRKEATEQAQLDISATQSFPGPEQRDTTITETSFTRAPQSKTPQDWPHKQERSIRYEEKYKQIGPSNKSIQAPAASTELNTATCSQPAMDARNIESQNFDTSRSTARSLASIDCLEQTKKRSRSPRSSSNKSKSSGTSLRDSLISRAEHRSKRDTACLNKSTALSIPPSPSQLQTSILISKDRAPINSFSKENTHILGGTDEFISSDAFPKHTNPSNLGASKHADLAPSATPAKRSPLEPKVERNVRTRRSRNQTQTDTVGSAKRVIHTVRTSPTSLSGSLRGPKTQREFAASERRAASQTSLLPRPSRIPSTEPEPRLRRSVRTRSTTNHTVIR
ncbi:hypothetical protein MPSI1_001536 [Malassezia psittaci]|uniref:Uncharacterized protein n=1 Tax=Malassezia psittaci TaxID=1821823 RepID=A0AAF0JJV9_9BASI|nr:hypothetical protein MPSI1_001536 [Malassezia psittaci]